MLDRLHDKQAAVRVQAIRFCIRFQAPGDPEFADPICERLVKMICEDTSVQVCMCL